MNYLLYVTDWAPNGTNDLLICDEDRQIVTCLEQVTFGIDVARGAFDLETTSVADDCSVFSMETEAAREYFKDAAGPQDLALVRQISLAELRRFLCLSPLDPQGTHITALLKSAGVDLEAAE